MAPWGNSRQYSGNILATRVIELIFNGILYTGVIPQDAPAGTVVQVSYAREASGENDAYYGYYALPVLGDIQIFTSDACDEIPQGDAPAVLYARINYVPALESGEGANYNWNDGSQGGGHIDRHDDDYIILVSYAAAQYMTQSHGLVIGDVYALQRQAVGQITNQDGILNEQ